MVNRYLLLIVKSLINVIVENQEYFLRAPSPTITSHISICTNIHSLFVTMVAKFHAKRKLHIKKIKERGEKFITIAIDVVENEQSRKVLAVCIGG